jgi:Transcriptional regulator containing an amidase domain and an AraC-type DNA-binding HTH domain
MLEKHPELTIEAIAADCGFNAPNTFYRLFQKNYEISPAEYRKIAGLVER